GVSIVGAIFRLIQAEENAKATEVLARFFSDKSYTNRIDMIKGYLETPKHIAAKTKWNKEYHDDTVNAKDQLGRNIISIIACCEYQSEDEAKEAIQFLDDYLNSFEVESKQKQEKQDAVNNILIDDQSFDDNDIAATKRALLESKDKMGYSVVGNLIQSESDYAPHMLALLVEHGIYTQTLQGKSYNAQSPEEMIGDAVTHNGSVTTLDKRKVNLELALNGKFDLQEFMNPVKSVRYIGGLTK
ncbi:MAG: hypothetical protein ACK4PR_07705, partial [Gammaproteobacteria bacterium]